MAPLTAVTGPQTFAIEQRLTPGSAQWRWVVDRPAEVLTMALVRADVRIVRWDRGRIALRAYAADPEGDGSPITLVAMQDERSLRIVDRYPPSPSTLRRECLPPDGEHGGAWTYHDRLTVVLMIPRTLRLSLSTLDGTLIGS